MSEGERRRDLDFRVALKRGLCSAEVEAEVPKLRAARAKRRAAKSYFVASSALMAKSAHVIGSELDEKIQCQTLRLVFTSALTKLCLSSC